DDIITITGTASRDNDIIRIEQELRKIPGVGNVINQLRLPPEMSDTYLEQEIRHELVNKNGINLDRISFSVRDGVATFSGHVGTHEEIDRILAQTLMIRGIKDVKSNVQIGGQP
ncbi:MAG: BON domain-containing protein, partial [SAR324 cluster bacterium]|nr:BON domain-containing protein [SAR324 cluster bacterium]